MDKVISLAMGIAMMLAVQGELKEARWWLLQQIYKHRKLGSLEEYNKKLIGSGDERRALPRNPKYAEF